MHPLLLEIPEKIETDRLVLRTYGAGDGGWYFEMLQRNMMHLASAMPAFVLGAKNVDETEILMRKRSADWATRSRFSLGVWSKAKTEFVAEIYIQGMDWETPAIELGYFADINHGGKGYVTEAAKASLDLIFDHMKAHKVCIVCDDANTKAQAIAERCGFVKEGVLREQKRRPGGGFISTRLYGLLREEYEALKKSDT